MKTLLINAHPLFKQGETYSAHLQNLFLEQFQEQFDLDNLTILNLYEEDLPRLEEDGLLGIWHKQAKAEALTPHEQAIFNRSQALLKTFKDNHRIVIVSPMHNFNIPSRLKDYLDNILIARETFRYTSEGSVGLMTDDYKVLYLQSSGSIYTNNDRYTPLEFPHFYLKEIFTNIMGMSDFYIVRAQGTNLSGSNKDRILKGAKEDLNNIFDAFYH